MVELKELVRGPSQRDQREVSQPSASKRRGSLIAQAFSSPS